MLVLCIFPKYPILYSIDTYTSMFIAVLFTISRKQKQLKWPSADEWIMSMW